MHANLSLCVFRRASRSWRRSWRQSGSWESRYSMTVRIHEAPLTKPYKTRPKSVTLHCEINQAALGSVRLCLNSLGWREAVQTKESLVGGVLLFCSSQTIHTCDNKLSICSWLTCSITPKAQRRCQLHLIFFYHWSVKPLFLVTAHQKLKTDETVFSRFCVCLSSKYFMNHWIYFNETFWK